MNDMFRGKRKDNGEWVKGWIFPIEGDKEGKEDWIISSSEIPSEYNEYEVHKQSIAIETGLKDKDGNDIYGSFELDGEMTKGGDLCKLSKTIDVIELKLGKFWLNWLDNLYEYQDNMEIIGNAFDNPELLKSNKNKEE